MILLYRQQRKFYGVSGEFLTIDYKPHETMTDEERLDEYISLLSRLTESQKRIQDHFATGVNDS